MPTVGKLTLAQQRRLIRAIPPNRRKALQKCCRDCEQSGEGIKSILKKAGDVLGFLGKEIGPTVLKELIIPMLKKKIGKGNTCGRGLSLAGAGSRTKRKKKRGRKKI